MSTTSHSSLRAPHSSTVRPDRRPGERVLPRHDGRTGRSLQRCVRWGTRPPFFRPWGGLILICCPTSVPPDGLTAHISQPSREFRVGSSELLLVSTGSDTDRWISPCTPSDSQLPTPNSYSCDRTTPTSSPRFPLRVAQARTSWMNSAR